MNVNSASSSSLINQTFNPTGKNSSKKIEAEEKSIENEINSLEQKKVDLNKEIQNVKGELVPPKRKEELTKTLQGKIAALDAEIQQKESEKSKKQTEEIKEASTKDNNKKSNSTPNNIESTNNSNNKKIKSDVELSNNFITQTGVRNEAKLKDNSKNSDVLSLKDNPYSNDTKNSDSINSIKDKNKRKYAEDALNAYNLIEHGDSINSTTNLFS